MWDTRTDTVKRLMESGTEQEVENRSESEIKEEGNVAFIHYLKS
jgi:hypothetical protein